MGPKRWNTFSLKQLEDEYWSFYLISFARKALKHNLEDERMLNALLGSCINSQIGNEASGQHCSLPIEHGFLSPGKVDFFPLLDRISCNLAFSGATELGPALMRNPKIKCCKLDFSPASQPLIWTSERNFMFNSKFGDFPTVSCHPPNSPLLSPLIYNTAAS